MARSKRAFPFELKSVDADGTFVGFASVYGNKDLGGDIVVKGAFTKTLQERGDKVPILWMHDHAQPIGMGTLEDTPTGLKIKGKLTLAVVKAAEVHALMLDAIVSGLSIGYETVKQKFADGARQLTELKLYEVSAVTFPMNEEAQVSAVKGFDVKSIDFDGMPKFVAPLMRAAAEKAASLGDRLCATSRAVSASFPMSYAYVMEVFDDFTIVRNGDELYSIPITAWDEDGCPSLGTPVKVEIAYVAAGGDKSAPVFDTKAGRVLSAANHESLKSAHSCLTKACEHMDSVMSKAAQKENDDDKKALVPGTSEDASTQAAEDDSIWAEIKATIAAANKTLQPVSAK